MGATGGETADLVDGMAKVKGTDTVVPGTFSFKEGTPRWFDELGENVVTVVFTPTDQHGYRTAETTIKVNVIKNTFKRCEEPDPITEKKLGTTFAGLNLPEIVVVEAIDGLRLAWRFRGRNRPMTRSPRLGRPSPVRWYSTLTTSTSISSRSLR